MEFFNNNYEPTVSDAIVTVSAHAAAMIEEAKRITGNALICKGAQDCRELLRYASEYTKMILCHLNHQIMVLRQKMNLLLG